MCSRGHSGLTSMKALLTRSLWWKLKKEKGANDTLRLACINSIPGQNSLYIGGRHNILLYAGSVMPGALKDSIWEKSSIYEF